MKKQSLFSKQDEALLIRKIQSLNVDVSQIMKLMRVAATAEFDKHGARLKRGALEMIGENAREVKNATTMVRKKAEYLRELVRELMRIHGGPWPEDDPFLRDNPIIGPAFDNNWSSLVERAMRNWMQEHILSDTLDSLMKAIDASESEALQSSGLSHFREVAAYRGPEVPGTLRSKDLSGAAIQSFDAISTILKAGGHSSYLKKTADLFSCVGIVVNVESVRKRLRRIGDRRLLQ